MREGGMGQGSGVWLGEEGGVGPNRPIEGGG